MANLLRHSLIFVITLGYMAAFTTAAPAINDPKREELDTLLARYDREPEGPKRERLARQIDAVAHQKYATVSRLYWHIDLESAKAAAREQGRPILHLRMLGRLDEDLSCANSRFFRATLYANRELRAFLRDRFVLYWSSERAVPRVTIDYGDGRRLERTIAGNSAHYIMDDDGRVLDILPGLYTAAAFRQELEQSLALVSRSRERSEIERAALLIEHHRQNVSAAERGWQRLAAFPGLSRLREQVAQPRFDTPVVAAQRVTATKVATELPAVRVIAKELTPPVMNDELGPWSAAGRVLYGGAVLDAASRALVVTLHNAEAPALRSDDRELGSMLARLEQSIVADTALNQLHVRPEISREIVRRGGHIEFDTLNAWIYDKVFRTPKQDQWLGLLQRDVFTALPGDGVVMRKR